ncbi:MAG: YdcF family protein [Clostridia bacterium]|nr:YdcF family protein [Clostridia bacterium]
MTREKRQVYLEKRRLHRQKRRAKKRLYAEKRRLRSSFRPLRALMLCAISAFFVLALTVGAINAVVVGSTAGDIRAVTVDEGYEIAVVFGAKVHEGGALSHMLQDRMDTAISLYHAGLVKKLLVSGDGRGEWSETKWMKKYAVDKGVAEADVIEDGEGYSTVETVTRANEIFGIEKCVLVTQKYHLYRAIYAAESMGMDAAGADAELRPYFGQLYRDVREIAARVKDFIYCI